MTEQILILVMYYEVISLKHWSGSSSCAFVMQTVRLPRPHYPNLGFIFLHYWETWSKELGNISDKSVDGSCWENWMTSTTFLPTQYLMLTPLHHFHATVSFTSWNETRKEIDITKLKPIGHSEMQNIGSFTYVVGFTVSTSVKVVWNCYRPFHLGMIGV
jgi:hypothetical protein